ncbi:MAG TPA: C25 family cysteine peptidase [Candidatus Syntrophosphaera sp.]|nr:C25 family cysteine peptidase [Candidatus Syntrophosphaera sp.]HQC47458.1 C25 family cysteine peptidase [Candidatus Syntrophosphaera sp.]
MRSYLVLALLLLPLVFLEAQISVVSQSADEVVLEFNLPEYKIGRQSLDGVTWDRIETDAGNVHAVDGFPELRVFGEAIAIPIDGDISLQVLNVKNSILKNVNLKPTLKMTVVNEEVEYHLVPDARAYRSAQLYPASIASSGESAFVGDRRFVPLQIFPFQYRAATKELVVNSSFTIRVQIYGSKSYSPNWQLSENLIDQVGNSFFLNNASSLGWRLPKKRDDSHESPKNGTQQVNAVQLVANQEGIYKITYEQLNDFILMMADSLDVEMAWLPETVDPRLLELTDEYGAIPIHFEGESDGSFDPGDYFEFFGDRHYGDEGYQDDYTSENVYSLYFKGTLGARMAVENGGLIVSNAAQYIVPDSYEHTVHIEQQLLSDKLGNSWSSVNPNFYREDIWFWRKINAPDLDIIPFELQYPKYSTVRTAQVKVCLYGLTYATSVPPGQYDHNATVRINEAMINTHNWIGQKEQIFENAGPVANSYFRHGTNHMYISLAGNTVSGDREQVLLDYLELKYWREYKTSEDKIKFTKPSNRPAGLYQFEIGGFSSNEVSVYKIGSSIFNNCQIEPFSVDGFAPWTVSIQDSVSSTEIKYYAVEESKKLSPVEMRLDIPSSWRSPNNAANVIMVGRRDFIFSEGGDLLTSVWEAEGHTVARVDYQDIFDEFNHGIRSAESLKELFSYAYNNWGPPQLSHVVLLGEGVDDERDNSPARIYALVPVKKTWTNEHGATASDGWYATIVGNDVVPDIAVARINAWKPEHVLDYAQKAFNYRNNLQTNRLWNSHVTITSGGKITDHDDLFAQQSETIRRRNIPQDYRAKRVYTSTQTVSSEYLGSTVQLKDAINAGTQYLHFIGHGGGRIWADYNLFNFNHVATLNNQTYPIVVSLACYASSFDTNGIASISEALVMQPNKGAIATMGFSGLGYMYQDLDWGLALTEAIYKHDFNTLGEAYQYTLTRFYATTTLPAARYALTNAAALMGDPLIKIIKPIGNIPVQADKYIAMPGDTLFVTAQFPADVTAARLYIMNRNEVEVNIPYDLPVINCNYNASYVIPTNVNPPYSREIHVVGYSPTREYVGKSGFGVGRAALMHHSTLPANPAWNDSVRFVAKVFSNEDIISLVCKARIDSAGTSGSWVTLPMEAYPQIENSYITTGYMSRQNTGKEIAFKYLVTTPSETYESFLNHYVTRGPDLSTLDIKLECNESGHFIKVLVKNGGDSASITTDLRLYVTPLFGTQTLFSTQDLPPFDVNEERWESISLDGLPQGNLIFHVKVNSSWIFPEWHGPDIPQIPNDIFDINNTITLVTDFNYYTVDSSGALFSSLDGNVSCEIPEGLVPSGQNAIFYINSVGVHEAQNQPDISPIKLRSYDDDSTFLPSNAYDIRSLSPALVDSTDTFVDNKKLKLTFYYSEKDDETQSFESENSYKIYRWESTGSKWILQGGNVSSSENKVVFEVRRQGIYTIYRNRDRIRPSIDVNVQDQEFTVGGYISGTGTFSLMLSDANGIDLFDNTIRLYLNGNQVPETDYVTTINTDNVNRIPIKYQLNLSQGTYSLVLDCKDVNGNYNTREIQFAVNETFDLKNVANYPNPIMGRAIDPKNDGRTRFTYVLTDDADEVTIKVYTVAGRLVKTFDNLPTGVGYHEYPRTVYGWDCKDDQGYYLANGTYFYRLTAKKGNKKIEKTIKMAILK